MGTFRAASPRDGFRESLHPNTSKMPMIKFSYFDIEAKGELTRLLLHAGNFDFEDHRIPISEWPGEHKAGTTFGQLPMLRWDGVELACLVTQRLLHLTPGAGPEVTKGCFVHQGVTVCHCNPHHCHQGGQKTGHVHRGLFKYLSSTAINCLTVSLFHPAHHNRPPSLFP